MAPAAARNRASAACRSTPAPVETFALSCFGSSQGPARSWTRFLCAPTQTHDHGVETGHGLADTGARMADLARALRSEPDAASAMDHPVQAIVDLVPACDAAGITVATHPPGRARPPCPIAEFAFEPSIPG